MHLDDEEVQRLLHGELAGAAAGTTRAHLERCAECRGRLAAAEQDETQVFDLLRRLDHAAPAVDPRALAERSLRRPARWARWAAGVVFALAAAGVAYAAPGSPVRAWVDGVARWITRPVSGSPPQAPVSDPGPSGIAIAPGERFAIVFTAPRAGGVAAVALTEGSQIVVRTHDGAARFTADVERLTIVAGDTLAVYEIDVPRMASWVEIRVGDRVLLVKRGPRVVTDAEPDAGGRYRLPLAGAPR